MHGNVWWWTKQKEPVINQEKTNHNKDAKIRNINDTTL